MVPAMKVWLNSMEFLSPAAIVTGSLQPVYNLISKGFHLVLFL
jgi:hypothetical protein